MQSLITRKVKIKQNKLETRTALRNVATMHEGRNRYVYIMVHYSHRSYDIEVNEFIEGIHYFTILIIKQ